MNLVQLGANVGNDHVQKFVEDYKNFTQILLVEPIVKCHPILKENYKNVKNVQIESSVIISDPNKPYGKVDFYFVDYPEYKSGVENYEVSSLNEYFTKSRGSNWENLGKKVELDSLNFEALVSKYNLQTVDFLFCDIEGEDEKLLFSLDLTKYDFKLVVWEENFINESTKLEEKFVSLGFKKDKIGRNIIVYKQEYENYIQNFRQWL